MYGASISGLFTLEFGNGFLYERTTSTYTSSGIEEQRTITSFSLHSCSSLVLHFAGNLSLIGGVSMALPLVANAEVTSEGIPSKPEMHVPGYTIEAQIGVALSL